MYSQREKDLFNDLIELQRRAEMQKVRSGRVQPQLNNAIDELVEQVDPVRYLNYCEVEAPDLLPVDDDANPDYYENDYSHTIGDLIE